MFYDAVFEVDLFAGLLIGKGLFYPKSDMQFYNIRAMHRGNQIILSHTNKENTSLTERAQIKLTRNSLFCMISQGFQTEDWLTDASILKQANSTLIVTQRLLHSCVSNKLPPFC